MYRVVIDELFDGVESLAKIQKNDRRADNSWSYFYSNFRRWIGVRLIFSVIQLNDADMGGRFIEPQANGILGICVLTCTD